MARQSMPLNDITNMFRVYAINLQTQNRFQHGFLPGRSCLTNLLAYLENVTKHVDSDYQLTLCIWTLLKHSIMYHIEDY